MCKKNVIFAVQKTNMILKVEVKTGKDYVKKAMLATKGIQSKQSTPLSNELWRKMLLCKHSPIEEYVVYIEAIVSERVHTHIVRHEEIGKYVSTSRPDLTDKIRNGTRFISLSINAKRMIEITEQRLCFGTVWGETLEFFADVVKQLDVDLQDFCVQPCVKYNFCINNNKCNFTKSEQFTILRNNFKK